MKNFFEFGLSVLIIKTLAISLILFSSCSEDCFNDDCKEVYKEHYSHKDKKGKKKNKKVGKSMVDSIKAGCTEKYEINENFEEFTGEVPDLCENLEICLTGKGKYGIGKVSVTHDEDFNLYVSYDINDKWCLQGVAIAIGVEEDEKLDILPLNEYNKVDLKKLPFLKKIENTNNYTVKINIEEYLGEKFKECVIIVAGAIVTDEYGCSRYLVWAKDCDSYTKKTACGFSLRNGKISRNEGGKFVEYCFDDYKCDEPYSEDVDYTYAWEDLRNKGNDADYNDLVIQAVLNKVKDKLIFKFLPVARGAGYDHMFKFGILNEGVVNVEGAAATEVIGDSLIITVFESTKAVLPPEKQNPASYSANVVYRGDNNDCLATSLQDKTVTITIDENYTYDKDKPYDPFITVYTSGSTSDDSKNVYDLHVWQVTGTDIWTKDGKEYPNGILIPLDWKWPKENKAIFSIYPDFSDISNWNDTWGANIAEPDNVIEKNFCE